jgi:tRNA nucleotidyltransferase (CCA-adding enzyme)
MMFALRLRPQIVRCLLINGNDLVALGLQGPQIGQELEALTNLVVDDPSLNDRDTLLKMVQEQL